MTFCNICGLATHESVNNICSIECMRTVYEGAAIAHLFPNEATTEERKALLQYDDAKPQH